MVIYLGLLSPEGSSDYESGTGRPMRFHLSCTKWGLHDGQVARPPVRSYRTFPPLPITRRYLSVALALESPPPAVSWHPALRCSDFPHAIGMRPFSCLISVKALKSGDHHAAASLALNQLAVFNAAQYR